MGVDYDAVLGVGVDQEAIVFETLTEAGKEIIHEAWLDSESDEVKEEFGQLSGQEASDYLSDWFSENWSEFELFDRLGLYQASYNAYSGDYYKRGVGLDLYDPDLAQGDIDASVEEFKRVCKLEPRIFCDLVIS